MTSFEILKHRKKKRNKEDWDHFEFAVKLNFENLGDKFMILTSVLDTFTKTWLEQRKTTIRTRF